MDLIKRFFIQTVLHAANSLRLSSADIELIGLLRQLILRLDDVEPELQMWKKQTELSRLGVRFYMIYLYLTDPQLEYEYLSQKFREYSSQIIPDLKYFLDNTNAQAFSDKMFSEPVDIREQSAAVRDKMNTSPAEEGTTDQQRERSADDTSAGDTEAMTVVKEAEQMLQHLEKTNELLPVAAETAAKLYSLSEQFWTAGNKKLGKLHSTAAAAITLLLENKVNHDSHYIASIRACLIVIVASIKRKEVDYSSFEKRAEAFEEFINRMKAQEN